MAEEQSREKVMINYQISHREIEKKNKSEIISITSQKGRYSLTKTMITYDTLPSKYKRCLIWKQNDFPNKPNQIEIPTAKRAKVMQLGNFSTSANAKSCLQVILSIEGNSEG